MAVGMVVAVEGGAMAAEVVAVAKANSVMAGEVEMEVVTVVGVERLWAMIAIQAQRNQLTTVSPCSPQSPR